RELYEPGDEVLLELGEDADRVRGSKLAFGRGCERCHQTGYRGRTGLFELLVVDDEIRRAISAKSSSLEIRSAAVSAGMRTLRESGIKLLLEGETTVEEVLRETGA